MTLIDWLYDPTPITAEWLVEIGGKRDNAGDYEFGNESWAVREGVLWELRAEYWGLPVNTRGEFRRAAELLGVVTTEVRPEDDRPMLLARVEKLECAIVDHMMSQRTRCENDERLSEVLGAKNDRTKGGE